MRQSVPNHGIGALLAAIVPSGSRKFFGQNRLGASAKLFGQFVAGWQLFRAFPPESLAETFAISLPQFERIEPNAGQLGDARQFGCTRGPRQKHAAMLKHRRAMPALGATGDFRFAERQIASRATLETKKRRSGREGIRPDL